MSCGFWMGEIPSLPSQSTLQNSSHSLPQPSGQPRGGIGLLSDLVWFRFRSLDSYSLFCYRAADIEIFLIQVLGSELSRVIPSRRPGELSETTLLLLQSELVRRSEKRRPVLNLTDSYSPSFMSSTTSTFDSVNYVPPFIRPNRTGQLHRRYSDRFLE